MIGRITNLSDLCVITSPPPTKRMGNPKKAFLFEFTIVVFRFKDFGSLKIMRDASPLMAAHSFLCVNEKIRKRWSLSRSRIGYE